MTLLILLIIILILVVIFQIAKISEFSTGTQDSGEISDDTNRWVGLSFLAILVLGLFGAVYSTLVYLPKFLPESASIHGDWIDKSFNTTTFWTGIVFVITHIILFWFAFKYYGKKGRKVKYFPKNNTLELIWTIVPAIVLTYLVIQGLQYWYKITADAGEDAMVVELTGKQFDWMIRYPGPDGKLGTKSYDKIGSGNILGLDFYEDEAGEFGDGKDDFLANELHLPKGREIEIKINAQDVLHSFFLPHFRVKMDAVPGIPTRAKFTAKWSTEEQRELLKDHPFWGEIDPETGEARYLGFNYELACAELCGRGHFSMRKLVVVHEEEDFEAWQAEQLSYYEIAVKGTDFDPELHPELKLGRLDLRRSGKTGHGDESHDDGHGTDGDDSHGGDETHHDSGDESAEHHGEKDSDDGVGDEDQRLGMEEEVTQE